MTGSRLNQLAFRKWVLVPLLAPLLNVCAGEARVTWLGHVDTLESGTVVVSNPPVGLWSDESAWRLVEEQRIGTRWGSGPEVFGAIADLEVDRLGRVYVLDRLAQEVRVFDTDGSHVRTIGRPGGGPGEFRGVTGMTFDPAGHLWVLNQGNVRYSVFDTTGALLKEPPRLTGLVRVAEWAGVFDRSGRLYDVLFYPTATRMTFAYARYDTATGEFVDTMPGVGFPRAPLFLGTHLGTQDGWWLGVATQYRLYLTSFAGDTTRIVERALSHLEQASVSRRPDLPQESVPTIPGVTPPALEKRILLELMEDEKRYLWVMVTPWSGEVGTILDVFDPAGRYLGMLKVPIRMEPSPRPVVRGDRVYGVVMDETDVPYVTIFRIARRTEPAGHR